MPHILLDTGAQTSPPSSSSFPSMEPDIMMPSLKHIVESGLNVRLQTSLPEPSFEGPFSLFSIETRRIGIIRLGSH